jgi:tyrosyl-tRNA synthetase
MTVVRYPSPLDVLSARGLVEQVTKESEVRTRLAAGGERIYVGFDPTESSLHVGHLLPVLVLSHLQQMAVQPIVLVGGATGMIGDPSGRSSERLLLTQEQVRENSEGIRRQLERFLDFEGDVKAILVNNGDWILPFGHVEWLRDVGKFFTVNYMLSKESVRRRLQEREGGISYTEFSYMLLQAYDFLHLFDAYGCRFQGGGNDQWGNITAGTDLIRKARGQDAFGLTFPLVTTSTGEKFGKSAGNAIWLDPKRTSPYQFYQYWIRVEDADVGRFLKLFTFLSLGVVDEILTKHQREPEGRVAQRALADEVTRAVHGDDQLKRAKAASEALFGGSLEGMSERELLDIFADVPSCALAIGDLEVGMDPAALLQAAGLSTSSSQARRLIKEGGAYLNNVRLTSDRSRIGAESLLVGALMVLRSGKRTYRLIRFV